MPSVQCFEIAAQACLPSLGADPIDLASGDDEISQVAELRRQQADEPDAAPGQPYGKHGDLRGLACDIEGQLGGLPLGQDIRSACLDFEFVAFGRVDTDLGEIATMDGIHLVASVPDEIDATSLGHVQENAHVREVAAGTNDAVLHPRASQ